MLPSDVFLWLPSRADTTQANSRAIQTIRLKACIRGPPKTGDAEPEDPDKPGWERSRTIRTRRSISACRVRWHAQYSRTRLHALEFWHAPARDIHNRPPGAVYLISLGGQPFTRGLNPQRLDKYRLACESTSQQFWCLQGSLTGESATQKKTIKKNGKSENWKPEWNLTISGVDRFQTDDASEL